MINNNIAQMNTAFNMNGTSVLNSRQNAVLIQTVVVPVELLLVWHSAHVSACLERQGSFGCYWLPQCELQYQK